MQNLVKNPESGLNLVEKLLKMTQIRRFYVIDIQKIIAKMRPKRLIQDNKDWNCIFCVAWRDARMPKRLIQDNKDWNIRAGPESGRPRGGQNG